MLGIHLPLSNPLSGCVVNATELGCDTFQIFIRNNRNMNQRSFSKSEINVFNSYLMRSNVKSVVVHASYAMNPCTDDEEKRKRYLDIVKSDMNVMHQFYKDVRYVIHPGSSMMIPPDIAMCNLVNFMSEVVQMAGSVTVCAEYMAGAGTQMIDNVEDCKRLLQAVSGLKLCFDTCHAFASRDSLFYPFSSLLADVGVLHLNNSFYGERTHKDRHAPIVGGHIPTQQLLNIAKLLHVRYPDVPTILETPGEFLEQDFRYVKEFIET